MGASLTFTLEDARGLLEMTKLPTPKKDEEDNTAYLAVCENSRQMLRGIAKRILYTEGPTSNKDELTNKFIVGLNDEDEVSEKHKDTIDKM